MNKEQVLAELHRLTKTFKRIKRHPLLTIEYVSRNIIYNCYKKYKELYNSIIELTNFLPKNTCFYKRVYCLFNEIDSLEKFPSCKKRLLEFRNNKNFVASYSKELLDEIKEETKFLDSINPSTPQRIWYILNDVKEVPTCPVCGKYLEFYRYNQTYGTHCSIICAGKNPTVKEKRRQFYLKHYGVEHNWQIKNKNGLRPCDETSIKRYGFVGNFKDPEIHKKAIIMTKTKESQEKRKRSYFLKTGFAFPAQNPKVQEQMKMTCFKKYGVKSVSQVAKIFDKKRYRRKKFVLPSGKIIKVQGYESFTITELLKIYNENDLVFTQKEIKKYTGKLTYTMNGIEHIYFPDMYIKSENKIVETKSTYTYKRFLEKNILKKEACESRGIKFEFAIVYLNRDQTLNKILKYLE